MKQLTLILALLPLLGISQKSFAPLNAVWNYEAKSEFNSDLLDCSGNHLQYIVEEEVDIDGRDCSLIRAYRSSNLDTVWRYTGDSLIVYEEESKIYFQEDSLFLLLFDFGAELGDTIVKYDPYKRGVFSGIYYPDSATTALRMEMYVTDISTVDIQGSTFTVQTLMSLDSYFYNINDRVLEGVGSLSQMFSGDYLNYTASGCDGELICYNNSVVEYETSNTFALAHPGCDYMPILDSVDDNILSDVIVYPNPFELRLNVNTDIEDINLKILDINGRVVATSDNQKFINTDDLISGIYLLQISNDEFTHIAKVTKM